MSAHHFPGTYGDHQVNFCIGWDRKRKSYFFEIISLSQVVLYRSEQSDHIRGGKKIECLFDLQDELNRLRVELPDRMLTEVAEDRLNNVGNRFCFYNERGFPTMDTVCSDGWERTVPSELTEEVDNRRVAKKPSM